MNTNHESRVAESQEAEDVQGFFTPVPIPGATPLSLASSSTTLGALSRTSLTQASLQQGPTLQTARF